MTLQTATQLYNIYCDESCHLERDHQPIMVLGALSVATESAPEVNAAIRALKVAHGYDPKWEVKWTKVSQSRLPFYEALVDYFLTNDDLAFRAVVAHNKDQLRHADFAQDHDDWYYKIYYQLLQPMLTGDAGYRIYLDIKQTNGGPKVAKLHEVLTNKLRDWDAQIVQRIQILQSDQVQLLQLADLLIGAVSYSNRGLASSTAKLALMRRVELGAGVSLLRNTRMLDRKVNLFHWTPQGDR